MLSENLKLPHQTDMVTFLYANYKKQFSSWPQYFGKMTKHFKRKNVRQRFVLTFEELTYSMIAAKQFFDQYSNTAKLFAFSVFKYKKVSSNQFEEKLL